MNLFWLSRNVRRSARAHCDQHVVKMPLEAVQLLYTAWAVLASRNNDESWRAAAPLNKAGTRRGYLPTHVNHPLARWVRRSPANYRATADYALALCAEYSTRFPGKTLHAEQHARWLRDNLPPRLQHASGSRRSQREALTRIPLCIDAQSAAAYGARARSIRKAVRAYREFYRRDKAGMARYRYCAPPRWLA
jgi:hypothetical protein